MQIGLRYWWINEWVPLFDVLLYFMFMFVTIRKVLAGNFLWHWKDYLTYRFKNVNIYIIFFGSDSYVYTIQIPILMLMLMRITSVFLRTVMFAGQVARELIMADSSFRRSFLWKKGVYPSSWLFDWFVPLSLQLTVCRFVTRVCCGTWLAIHVLALSITAFQSSNLGRVNGRRRTLIFAGLKSFKAWNIRYSVSKEIKIQNIQYLL